MNIIPEKLKRARRSFDDLPQITLLEDWQHNVQEDRWYIKIQIEITKSSQYVPKQTDWYVVISSAYPFGNLKIYPAAKNSIIVTFPHQSNNSKIDSSGLWRTGDICTTVIDRLYTAEPFDIDSRLFFHVQRAIFWLEDAASGTLVSDGDLFELPSFDTSKNSHISIAFSEDAVSYMQWEYIEAKCGIAVLSQIPNSNVRIYRVNEFKSLPGQDKFFVNATWGSLFESNSSDIYTAIWIKLLSTPVLNVWQPPSTLRELKEVCYSQGIDLFALLRDCLPRIRDNKRHLLLLGFPIPKYHKGEGEIIFWQALLLPYLSVGKKTYNGFRPGEPGWWLRDKVEILKDDMELEWINSENWNEREISLRGQLPLQIKKCNIAIIGCGSLGSTIAELFVRSGAYKIHIIDNDIVKVGNLSRHILATSDIGCSKSKAVANRLNTINPHARVSYSVGGFYSCDNGTPSIDISKSDIIIDCTGENSVLNALSAMAYKSRCHVISISIGLEAKRIYINMQNAQVFQYDSFFEVISKYLVEDEDIAKKMALPRDGTGCWHPTFPARNDDIVAVSSLAIKAIETYIISQEKKPLTLVFEQENQNGFITGYNIIEKVAHE